MYYYTNYKSIIGNLIIVSDKENIVGLFIEGQKNFYDEITHNMTLNNNIEILNKTTKWLDRYFNRENPSVTELSIKLIGSDFRKLVWNILLEIPYSKTVTYLDIAKKVSKILNKNMSSQAIGGAVGHNPISIIVPCHRVIGTNGSLVGYAGGLSIKRKLLDLEKDNMHSYFE